jgi:hypothetical protein
MVKKVNMKKMTGIMGTMERKKKTVMVKTNEMTNTTYSTNPLTWSRKTGRQEIWLYLKLMR